MREWLAPFPSLLNIFFVLWWACLSGARYEEPLTDSELIASILAGDASAFGTLVRQHKRMLLRTARAILRNDADAEDAVQDALVQAHHALASFRGESKLSTWLVRITANAALMRRRRAQAGQGATEPEQLASGAPGPERQALRGELRKRIEESLDELPEDYRIVFRLRALEDLDVERTASVLRIPQATVRSRYFRARALLRKSMARESDRPSSLEVPLLILERDRERLRRLRPHAALLREIDRATLIRPREAAASDAVIMNSQVRFTDETTGTQGRVNIVYPSEAGGCACCVSILAPVGTALIGLSIGQAIDWEFADGSHRLVVNEVIQRDCPLNTARAA
jgi:RNA polymerase sigma-70 factor, ECF subfamily